VHQNEPFFKLTKFTDLVQMRKYERICEEESKVQEQTIDPYDFDCLKEKV
jgi:hypothetical protein